MAAKKRKKHPAAFQAQVALAALQGDKTVEELASQHGIPPSLIQTWKEQLLQGAESVFAAGARAAPQGDSEASQARLSEQVGRLQVELDWLKGKAAQVGGLDGGPTAEKDGRR